MLDLLFQERDDARRTRDTLTDDLNALRGLAARTSEGSLT
jgi:hypothetical protein